MTKMTGAKETVLFTAKHKTDGTYQEWIRPADVDRKRKAYESGGWKVRCQVIGPGNQLKEV